MRIKLRRWRCCTASVQSHWAAVDGPRPRRLISVALIAGALAMLPSAAGSALAQTHPDQPHFRCVIITKQITCFPKPETRHCNGPNPSPFCSLRQEPPPTGEPSPT